MAGLSTAANAFSVVGLADTVFRLGVSTASLYSRYRNASNDIASLVDEIQALMETVAQIRLYLDEYHQSPYVQVDGQILPPHLSKTLSDCQKLLQSLQQLADKNKNDPHDGIFIRVMKNWRWTLQNEHVLKSRDRVVHLNANLQTILVLNGRKNEIVLRNELNATRTDITTTGLTVNQALNSLEGNLTTKQEDIETHLKSQTTLMSQLMKHSKDHHLSLKNKMESEHEKSNELVLSQTNILINMMKTAEDHHHQLMNSFSSLTVEQTDDDDFIFQGENLGSIVLPLLLMKSDLFKTIKTLQKEGVLKVSRSEADWITQHFENLLARSHEAAAKGLKGRRQNERTKSSPEIMNDQSQENISEDTDFSTINPVIRVKHMSALHTSTGLLILQTGTSNKPFKRQQDSADLQVFQLSFFPKPEFSSINISMLMTNESGRNMQLQIPRLIQTYNTVPRSWEITNLITSNDVRGLETYFRSGKGSPNDIFEEGMSLLQFAAAAQSISVCKFLIREGASASMYFPSMIPEVSINLLDSIWSSPYFKELGTCYATGWWAIGIALRLSSLAIKQGCDPNMLLYPVQRNIMQAFIDSYCGGLVSAAQVEEHSSEPRKYSNLLLAHRFRGVFSSMVRMGCELEGRDTTGDTALHQACLMVQPNMITALISIGADINATNLGGEGLLHQLLDINGGFCDYEKLVSEINLYRGLVIVLASKADPNHLNDFGASPSDYASEHPMRLGVWKKAVLRAGYKTLTIRNKAPDCDCEGNVNCHCEEQINYHCEGHIPDEDEEIVSVIVSAEFELSSDDLLPISNLTLDEWIKKRRKIEYNAISFGDSLEIQHLRLYAQRHSNDGDIASLLRESRGGQSQFSVAHPVCPHCYPTNRYA